MDFQLKQWRNQQHESEEQQPYSSATKIPKLEHLQTQTHPEPASGYALPLFVPEPNTKVISNLSAFSESITPTPASSATRFPRMGSYFSMSQWQELELQALIFRYMLAGAAVPPELLQPIKRSLLHSQFFFHHPLQQYPALLQSGYWGRGAMDPEPTRCRRTDGKKWRCSRDVVTGQKYCERHVHRGRNRSRKHVEVTTTATTTTTAAGGGGVRTLDAATSNAVVTVASSLGNGSDGTHFALSGSSPSIDLLQLKQSSLESKHENKSFFDNRREVSGSIQSDNHILRPFFDDWPGQLQEPDNGRGNASSMNSATSLSISIRGNTSSSDVSLKLSTGNGVEPGQESEQPQLNWPTGWGTNHVASMGGPLAEALRSSNSNSNSSPTSVLHRLPRGSVNETSFIST
ncbi:putative transcription factor interactor and regulator C3H-WRC/GRF family [Rosa chinensis]|uniref:Growth-regulating factor n=1 Tax=Rosa chinensis TaxID=74649 RepID=A0A2P6RBK6_ROSCH|nr:growth-regulating factor 3 isoform X1 [Rosa chinensis]PRQ43812.1 putative transcription factor interactor and regulator C3H-WRC/GRF family [Rosa chinensis]